MEAIELKGTKYYDSGIDILGVPYGGPDYLNGNDLDEENFNEKTDTGPLPYVLTFFDHGKSVEKGKELIGVSQFLEKTDFGELYRIWVRESDEYEAMIAFLQKIHREGLLKTSSHPFQRTAEKTTNGEWLKWHVVELTVTAKPANPLATSIITEEKMEEVENKNTAETPVTEMAEKVETTSTPEVIDIAEKIKEKFAVEGDVKEKADISVSIYGRLDEVLAELVKMGTRMDMMEKDQKKHVEILINGLDAFAGEVAKTLTGKVKIESTKSIAEKAVEKTIQEANTNNVSQTGGLKFKNMKGLG